ncbi:MAG: hypothetical protein A4E32_01418 [Methanomassiliicoccales archaeon PtaU1.Bin124]|nr:MAG: hypothetical protein A4E32_01418 [Methanomassiliicoccales archaeon PtaU1.Bin124]
MNKGSTGKDGQKKGILSFMFPSNYDFYQMLFDQAQQTQVGVRALHEWLISECNCDPEGIRLEEEKGDGIRLATERQLQEAFSTPFDRQDIYTMSRQMDHILNYSLTTAYEMRAFGVQADNAIMTMTKALENGVDLIAKSVMLLKTDPQKAEETIPLIRGYEHEIEKTYVQAISTVFAKDDPITAMKKREVYHHLKDAGRNMSITVDVLHRIIVGLT